MPAPIDQAFDNITFKHETKESQKISQPQQGKDSQQQKQDYQTQSSQNEYPSSSTYSQLKNVQSLNNDKYL